MLEGNQISGAIDQARFLKEIILVEENLLSAELALGSLHLNTTGELEQALKKVTKAQKEVKVLPGLTTNSDHREKLQNIGAYAKEIQEKMEEILSLQSLIARDVNLLLEESAKMYKVAKEGAEVGALKVAELSPQQYESLDQGKLYMLILVIISTVLGVVLSLAIIRPIRAAVQGLLDGFERAGEGDLAHHIHNEQGDELGQISRAMNTFTESLSNDISRISDNANDLMHRESLRWHPSDGRAHRRRVQKRHRALGLTARRHGQRQQRVLQHSPLHLHHRQRPRKLSGDIARISENCEREVSIANEASRLMEKNNRNLDELVEATQKISETTTMIVGIADQTSLLALNATIEAASAGEADKGFAVVANEVKALAGQTVAAADTISQRVRDIEENMGKSVASNDEVSKTIEQIQQISDQILQSLEQQSRSSQEMVNAADEANQSVLQMDGRILNSKESTNSIADRMGDVDQATEGTLQEISKGREVAQSLDEIARVLKGLVEKFKT